MRIVLTASEAIPFAKTGGLADVTSALCESLASLGHQVSLILPYYPQVAARSGTPLPPLESTGLTFRIPIGQKQVVGRLLRTQLPHSTVDVYLVDQPDYFDRPSLYQEAGRDYRDNCERFVFLSRAVLEAIRLLDLRPDIVHAHDWQTGLVPAMLKIENRHVSGCERTAAVFTVHNMAFQGIFWHWDMVLTGLDWKYFNWHQMEFFGNLNLLKSGLVFADVVTTVSPSYAQEIQSPELGCGLHGVIRARGKDVVGILNGVDTAIWNPARDRNLAQTYTLATAASGKALNKAALLKRIGLPVRGDVPIIGMISRLTEQKGLDLFLARAEQILQMDLQLVFLGSGEERFERALQDLALRHPDKVHAAIGFDDGLAHLIEAGADMYLMPSRFEPCGLNQMYSLMYGTVPLVREVGGLRDTVVNATPETLAKHTANGFSFRDYDAGAFEATVRRAVAAFSDRAVWQQLIETGMSGDWSWRRSALQYQELFERAKSRYECGELCSAPG
jgi:starch synthase